MSRFTSFNVEKPLLYLLFVVIGFELFLGGYLVGTTSQRPDFLIKGDSSSARRLSASELNIMRQKVKSFLLGVQDPEFHSSQDLVLTKEGAVVASKNGTRYYPKSCGAAKRIKPEFLLAFSSATAAEEAGYTRSTQCK